MGFFSVSPIEKPSFSISSLYLLPLAMVPVADFQITYGNSSGNGSKKVFPRLVFRHNMTKIWVGGSTIAPKDRPRCGFNNELCPPPTKKQEGLFIDNDTF